MLFRSIRAVQSSTKGHIISRTMALEHQSTQAQQGRAVVAPRVNAAFQRRQNAQCGGALVHGVEVDRWHPPIDELLAQVRHHIQTEGLDRSAVVAEAGQLQLNAFEPIIARALMMGIT